MIKYTQQTLCTLCTTSTGETSTYFNLDGVDYVAELFTVPPFIQDIILYRLGISEFGERFGTPVTSIDYQEKYDDDGRPNEEAVQCLVNKMKVSGL